MGRLKRFFKKAKLWIASAPLAIASIPAALCDTGTSSIDMSGIVNIVLALMPVIIVLIVVKTLLNTFGKLT